MDKIQHVAGFPLPFVEATRRLLGEEAVDQLFVALQADSPVSVRLNEKCDWLGGALPMNPVPWCRSGYYLDRRLTFTFDPLFHAGCYYVQEASSMFLEQALRQYLPDMPVTMLDLCAAPGGKSTHARSLLPQGSLLVANEVIRNRSQILVENLTKWGNPDVVVTNNDPADFAPLKSFFDVVLTDVPCSGEGMFRKDQMAIEEWSVENVDICWQRQRRILTDIWPCLKPGGLLIYSTCTYNTKENEENVRWLRDRFGAEVLPIEISEDWNVTGNLLPDESFPVYRFLPHRTKGEGFFLAVLRKPEGDEDSWTCPKSRGKGGKPQLPPKEQLATVRKWLWAPEKYNITLDGNLLYAFPNDYRAELSALQDSLRVLRAGVTVAEVKGRDCLPHHALAMSLVRHPDAFGCEAVTYEQAIAYLRKEAVILSTDAPRGVLLLTYKSVPLGFVKNIGNRANNLYPQEWRIRSGHLPEEVLTLLSLLYGLSSR